MQECTAHTRCTRRSVLEAQSTVGASVDGQLARRYQAGDAARDRRRRRRGTLRADPGRAPAQDAAQAAASAQVRGRAQATFARYALAQRDLREEPEFPRRGMLAAPCA